MSTAFSSSVPSPTVTVHLKAVVSVKVLSRVASIFAVSLVSSAVSFTATGLVMLPVDPWQVNVLSPESPAVVQVILLVSESPTFCRVSSTVCSIHSLGDFKPQEIVPEDVSPAKTAPLVSSSGISQFKAKSIR